MIKHVVNFIKPNYGKIEVIEPIGFDAVDFGIEQEEGRLGRDVSFVGNRKSLRFTDHMHYTVFPIFMDAINDYGYEAEIKHEIHYTDDIIVLGEYDLANCKTDGKTFIEAGLQEENYRVLLKRREDINTNLFSSEDLDGNPITPVQTHNVLVKAKPTVAISKWESEGLIVENYGSFGQDFAAIAPFPQLTQYDIKTTLSPFYSYKEDTFSNVEQALDEATILRAQTSLANVKIKLTNINLSVTTTGAQVTTVIRVGWGNSYAAGTYSFHTFFTSNSDFVDINDQDYEYTIPFLNNTDFVFLIISVGSGAGSSPTPVSTSQITYSGGDLTIEATAIAADTVVPMVRLIDALKYTVKSTSGLDISAPRWEEGGEFYDEFITTTPLMRNLIDKPFNISFKEITDDYYPEPYGDFQIEKDGTVFMGRYPDFYANYECGVFTQSNYLKGKPTNQFQGYEKTYNPKFRINQFKYEYSSFASQKESEQANTYDILHGVRQSLVPITKDQNRKEVKVGWIRDPFLIEQARQKAYDLTDTAATQDDDKKYPLSIVPLEEADRTRTYTFPTQHVASGMTLTLLNDQTFSWVLLGITPGTPFIIVNPATNLGQYTVQSLDDRKLVLLKTSGGAPSDISEANTTFKYVITNIAAQYTIRTDEGFAEIENIADGDNFANLLYTVQRNTRNYYSQYLAACCAYTGDALIKKTLYSNNPEAYTRLSSETVGITEGEDFKPTGAILTPVLHKAKLIMTFKEYFQLEENLRTYRGFIRFHDANGMPLTGYIQKGEFKILNKGYDEMEDYVGELECEIEERYQPFYLELYKAPDTGLILNGVDYGSGFDWSIDSYGKLHIFDETGKLLYVPVEYNRVKVNNSGQASSPVQLTQWLNAIN